MTSHPSDYSRFAQRIRRRYADQLTLLPPGVPGKAAMQATLQVLQGQGLETGAALRVLRQLVLERLVVLDCDEQAPLAVVTRVMTELAELALDVAIEQSSQTLAATYGEPQTPQGTPAQMWVVGMGKLGARELNVSSDIDLIYVYDQDGQTTGQGGKSISNHEYFALQAKAIYQLLGHSTEHGFVFRLDLALRPNGNSGPAAVSLRALDEYFQTQGREWERFAWLKSRVVAPTSCIFNGSAYALRGPVLPFVFRRYLDYNVFDALRQLHRQIREHAATQYAGRPERANDVKISRGGIREIEFTVQLLQVVRGGQYPELRTRPTLQGLQRLAGAGLMPAASAEELAQAYEFLRRVEHRIQYLDDQQTHLLPTRADDVAWIAQTLGYRQAEEFLRALHQHREVVAREFDTLLGSQDPSTQGGVTVGPSEAKDRPALDALLAQPPQDWPERFRARIMQWSAQPQVHALPLDGQQRLTQLVLRTAVWLDETSVTEEAAVRFVDWLQPLLNRESYLALLLERPAVHERLLRLLGAAKWPARYLLQHPEVIDELACDDMLHERFDAANLIQELEQRLAALRSTGEDSQEACLNLLRRAHHAEVFRTLARDVEGVLTVEQVADDLSALAQTVLELAARWSWQALSTRHRETPRFAIIAYGKLGGKELGYGSDLDLVFVYDDEHEQAAQVYTAYTRKLIGWLTVKTSEGDLFEVDTALRPNGISGLLVTSFEAYAKYQQQHGSNAAWIWEHQAMTRARCVLGDPVLVERFEQVRHSVIACLRDPVALRQEIEAMCEKVRAANPVKSREGAMFDLKYSKGGMIDAEFAVQFLVLSQASRHPQLTANVGNIALLIRAEEAGLLPEGVGRLAANAYRELRRVQHRARLNEEPTQVVPPVLQAEREAVLTLWAAVFGPIQGEIGP